MLPFFVFTIALFLTAHNALNLEGALYYLLSSIALLMSMFVTGAIRPLDRKLILVNKVLRGMICLNFVGWGVWWTHRLSWGVTPEAYVTSQLVYSSIFILLYVYLLVIFSSPWRNRNGNTLVDNDCYFRFDFGTFRYMFKDYGKGL